MLRFLKTQWWFGAVFQRCGAETTRRSRKLGARVMAVTDVLADALSVAIARRNGREAYSRYLARRSAACPANNWRRLASRSS